MGNISKSDSICVLILNYQSYADTIKYVGCLQKQENIELKILIVDNCSPNGSYEILRNTFKDVLNVEVIKSEKNGGYAYGNNFGLRYLEEKNIDYIIINNNDINIEDPMLINNLIQMYQELKNPALVVPLMYTNGKQSKFLAWKIPTFVDDMIGSLRATKLLFGGKIKYKFDQTESTISVDCLQGSFFMGKKNIFYDIGLIDENTFLYGEEVILTHKVKKIGLKNYLCRSLKYEHSISKTISSELDKFKMMQYAVENKMYYHEAYSGVSKEGTKILKYLFNIWKIETMIYVPLKVFSKKIKGFLNV